MIPPPVQQGVRNLGAMIAVLSSEGDYQQHLGGPLPGEGVSQFTAPHGVSTDSHGSEYVAEVAWPNYFSNPDNTGMETPPLGEVVSLRKWRRL